MPHPHSSSFSGRFLHAIALGIQAAKRMDSRCRRGRSSMVSTSTTFFSLRFLMIVPFLGVIIFQ